jgi:hypothetical protein
MPLQPVFEGTVPGSTGSRSDVRIGAAVVTAPSYRGDVIQKVLDFYRAPSAMTALPDHPALGHVPSDFDALRRVVQGLLLHRDWAVAYGVAGDAIRIDEQNLRSTVEVLTRALELSASP